MIRSNAEIKGTKDFIAIEYNDNKVVITKDEFARLINENITKEHFLQMASDMVEDLINMEGYSWSYSKKELNKRLSFMYDYIVNINGYNNIYSI